MYKGANVKTQGFSAWKADVSADVAGGQIAAARSKCSERFTSKTRKEECFEAVAAQRSKLLDVARSCNEKGVPNPAQCVKKMCSSAFSSDGAFTSSAPLLHACKVQGLQKLSS